MKKVWKILALVMAFVIAISATAAITMALLQDTDGAVNVMVSGNVYVEQYEQQRDAAGELEEFQQNKPWLPVTVENPTTSKLTISGVDYDMYDNANIIDKIVDAKNVGTTNAYLRTVIAVECPNGFDRSLLHLNLNQTGIDWAEIGMIQVDGTQYLLLEATYTDVVGAGERVAPSLLQLYLDYNADNEDVELYEGDVSVLVMTQAVQAGGFNNAEEALNAAFGDTTTDNHPWKTTTPAKPLMVYSAQELQAALDAGEDVEVFFGADIEGTVVVNQPGDKDVNVIINGNGKQFDGQIKIKGNSSNNGTADDSVLIKNVDFVTETASQDFIWSADSQNGSVWRYAHNVTVQDCTFTATGAAQYTAVGARFQQSYNIKLVNCTATGMHSLLQAESCGSNVSVEDSKIINGKNGISMNNTKLASVKNTSIESVVDGGYGIRHKGQQNGYSLSVENCQISAFVPVLIRNMTGTGYTAAFTGTNTLTATNGFGYQVVLCAGDWDDDAAQPAAPTGTYTVTGVEGFTVFEG